MKILFISDIHGIDDNLRIIDNVIKDEEIDRLVVLGDLYNCGVNKSVEDFLLKYQNILICMKGNCDRESVCYSSPFQIIKDLSLIVLDDLDIYITHGDIYNNRNKPKFKNKILVYGHEHIPYMDKDDNVYICVGSISLPRGESSSSYMIYDNKKFTIYSIDGEVIEELDLNE